MDIVVKQLNAIVGEEHVLTEPGELACYGADNISFIPQRLPLLAVKPGSVEEIQAILRVASLRRLPVIPCSSACCGHGASIPSVPGLTLDLQRLNRIHLIDEVYRNAVIEPGVSFAQLQQQAKEKGFRVLCPLELPSVASVVSTYVEMTPLFAWPRYGTESVLTMEVMMPGGELLKTGMAAIPVIDKPYFPFGTTPSYFNKVWFGSQGTLGIVTKAVVKLKTDYETKKVLFIPADSFEELLPALKEIKRLDSPVEFFIADSVYLAGMLADSSESFSALSDSLPGATAVLVIRGETERVSYQQQDLQDLSATMGFTLAGELTADAGAAQKVLDEIEEPRGYERFKLLRGGYAVMPFICMARQVPLFNRVVGQIAQQFSCGPGTMGSLVLPVEPARLHFQYSFYSDPSNRQQQAMLRQLYQVLSTTLIKMGAFFSRPYGDWAGKVYEKADAYKSMVKKIKSEIDPENIMNPGKLNL